MAIIGPRPLLTKALLNDNRIDDLKRALEDPAFRQKLLEVAVKLIDYYYKKYEHTPVDAINHAMVRIRGSYALAVMFQDYPGEIYVARKDSPMIIGVENGDCQNYCWIL